MMAKLDSQRVDQIYEKLTGHRPIQGSWNVEKRNLAQKIVYIDEACRSVLSAIADIENAKPGADIRELEKALRTEFNFLNTFNNRPAMPALTRRLDPDVRQECWLVYYGDVHVGAITERSGNPTHTDHWEWRCGFYPGSNPGDGSAPQRVSMLPVRHSRLLGETICPSGAKPTSRNGAIKRHESRANMRCGNEANGCHHKCRVRRANHEMPTLRGLRLGLRKPS
jgi:hypothetical protein